METNTYELATTIARPINITNLGNILEGLNYKRYPIRDGWAGVYKRQKDHRQFSFCISMSEGKPIFTVQNLATLETFRNTNSTAPWISALGEQVSGPKLFGLDTEFYASLVKCHVCEREPTSPRELKEFFHKLSDEDHICTLCTDHDESSESQPAGMYIMIGQEATRSQDTGYGKVLIIFVCI